MSVQVGTRFRRPYADSNALWEVTKHSGAKVWEAVIVNEPIEINGHMIDGDYAGVVDVFREDDIERTLAMQQTWVTIADESDQWWANLPLGQVVHYHNGFDQFVRGEIVLHDGEKQMKPTALVGEWRDHDLPTRWPNGQENYPFHVDQINKGEPFRPHASNMYEYPKFSDRGNIDPRNLLALPITLPPMTPDEEEVARLVNVCTTVGEFLGHPQHQGGRVVLKAQIIEAIAALKQGLADA